MNHILVIDTPSIDVLHLEDRTVTSVGGAGMYTAMAARRCGVQVTMFGPVPDPIPEQLQPVSRHLTEWLGPTISPEDILRFEISYRGGKTEYIYASLDAILTFSPDTLPPDLSKYDAIHLPPFGDAEQQMTFVRACKQRGAKKISGGTGLFIVEEKPQVVLDVIGLVDYFFMNNQEVVSVFGSLESARTKPGKVLYVTQGAQGASIIQGDTHSFIPAVSTTVLDPTGAGDTFCGATLAYLIQEVHPILAARRAVALSAEMITQVGPTALLSADPAPEAHIDERVQVDEEQVRGIAEVIKTLAEFPPYNFIQPEVPPNGDPKTLDYFFAFTLQQFSFWSTKNNRYHLPLIAQIGGVELKGSDYLWEGYRRWLEADADFASPERQANLSREELLEVFQADDGDDPMPALDLHLEISHDYGRDMLALGLTPQAVLEKALASPQPLRTFILILDHIGGYKEDPIRKKSNLLAMILNQRPEAFFPLRGDEQIAPITDYHAMRSCLRMGLIDVIDEQLRHKLINRQILSLDEEWAVRYAAYQATEQLVALSGKRTGEVDWFFFNARKRCPEMTEPECQFCQVDAVCAKYKELFQPVIRTSFY
jgi:ribokinase